MLRSSSNRGFLSAGLDNSRYLGGEGDKGEMREKRRVVRKGKRGREEGRGSREGGRRLKEEIEGERGRKETREGGIGSGREGDYKLTPCDMTK